MSIDLRAVSQIFYCAATLPTILMGLIYLSRNSFMPYHSVAMGHRWEEVSPGTQAVMLAAMRVMAGGMLAFSALFLIVLFTAFSVGASWAVWGLPACALILLFGTLSGMKIVARRTSASPPIWMVYLSGLLLIVGFAASLMRMYG